MILGIVGSRRRNTTKDKELIRKKILELQPSEITSGGCSRGADRFAEELAKDMNIPTTIFKPHIEEGMKYYQMVKAYYNRNKKIAEHCDVLLAQVAKDRKGGTENTINYAFELGKQVIII